MRPVCLRVMYTVQALGSLCVEKLAGVSMRRGQLRASYVLKLDGARCTLSRACRS